MLCSNISVFLSAIPPEKRKRTKRPTIVEEEKPPESEDAEKTEEGGAEAEPKEEPKEEIKEEPKAQPYKVTLNGNVPCAILLHHARKVYIKEERKEKGENAELLVTVSAAASLNQQRVTVSVDGHALHSARPGDDGREGEGGRR
mmetsp:Transcript_18022/g.59194  ORF Transcript_18022/g.59194 Transcript_18022/m.59194 type:complete len:144 (-) Transcript_18022:51-482(-)